MNQVGKWIRILAFIAGVICVILGIIGFIRERNAGKEYEELLGQHGNEIQSESSNNQPPVNAEPTEMPAIKFDEEEKESETSSEGSTEETTSEAFTTREDIDFAALQKLNPDIYAWIEVPGTNVDYPIVQHPTDNSYYLTHTIEHKETVAASIYTELYNSKDFTDAHTVIYGHNMKNGSMFRTLHNFEDADFFEENRDVIIYMPEQTLYYEVFAAYTYDNRHLLHSYYFEDPEIFDGYLKEVFANKDFGAMIDHDMEVTSADRIITLSTCVNSGASTQRYLVQAVLVSIDQ